MHPNSRHMFFSHSGSGTNAKPVKDIGCLTERIHNGKLLDLFRAAKGYDKYKQFESQLVAKENFLTRSRIDDDFRVIKQNSRVGHNAFARETRVHPGIMYRKFKPNFFLPGAISPNPRAVKRTCV
jgi:hypothetical protein